MPDFIALMRKADRGYDISFPDFPSCRAEGASMEEARVMASQALAFCVEDLARARTRLPTPTRLDAIMDDPGNAGAVVFSVYVPKRDAKHVPFTATMPWDTLEELDKAAQCRGLSRSALLTQAAERVLVANG